MCGRYLLLASAAVLMAGCRFNGDSPPALILASHQSVQLPRERAYVACATALHRTYADRKLHLRAGYRTRVLATQDVRVVHLDGHVVEGRRLRSAQFICATDRSRKSRVLGVSEVTGQERLLRLLSGNDGGSTRTGR